MGFRDIEQVRFEPIAIELEGRDVRAEADEGLVVVFERAVVETFRLPLEPEIVFVIVLTQEVLFEVENLVEVIPAQLHQRFADFLCRAGGIFALVEQ